MRRITKLLGLGLVAAVAGTVGWHAFAAGPMTHGGMGGMSMMMGRGEAQGGNMTIGFYAGSRAYMPRRWRLPGPRVERGDPI